MFGNVMKRREDYQVPQTKIKQSEIYTALEALTHYNDTYKKAGAVHGCAVCKDDKVLSFVEDVGRHNAVDTLAGEMWLNKEDGADKIFYTTGRLTSGNGDQSGADGYSCSAITFRRYTNGLRLGSAIWHRPLLALKACDSKYSQAQKIEFDVKGEQ